MIRVLGFSRGGQRTPPRGFEPATPPFPRFPPLRCAPCKARRKQQAANPCWAGAETDGLTVPQNSGGIAALEGRRCKVSGACRVGARSFSSRSSRVPHQSARIAYL